MRASLSDIIERFAALCIALAAHAQAQSRKWSARAKSLIALAARIRTHSKGETDGKSDLQ